jgi:hypothetical protein
MADYYSLIACEVAALNTNTGAAARGTIIRRAADLKVSNSENSTEHSKKSDTEHCVENCARFEVAHDMPSSHERILLRETIR